MRETPAARKTPYEHKVHKHKRKTKRNLNVVVHDYKRGQGYKPEESSIIPRSAKAKREGANLGFGPLYNITVEFEDKNPEIFAVRTNDPQKALNVGLSNVASGSAPSLVKLKRR